ncbi:MAG TPA: gamma-glutamyl-gamma-aminobutyrate hydrolase family protein [Armatimonadota bacterium]|nr:gamma-glutamyl-gamma-aminobutyrate hydrolase family protein [Armatimonadota bacterium]
MAFTTPLIAVTGKRAPGSDVWTPRSAYLGALESAGAAHLAIQRREELGVAAGLLLTGGGDIAPWRYGRAAQPRLGPVDEERDELELELVADAQAGDLPVLAICRGMQVLVVAHGGRLWQDLPSELPHSLDHGRGAGRGAGAERASHQVLLGAGTVAAAAVGAVRAEVNSSHHQAAQTVGDRLVISGWGPDGVIEAVEMPGARFVLAVQWHPEDILECAGQAGIFAAFVAAARRR